MEFSNDELSNWHIYSIVPSFVILMVQPKLVPAYISYKNFIGGCILLFLIFILLIPGLVDISYCFKGHDEFFRFIMKMNYMLMNLFSSKLYSPAINMVINYSLDKKMRSAMNSIFYLGVSFSLYLINYISKKLTNHYFDDLLEPETSWVKYKALGFFLILQLFSFLIIMTAKIGNFNGGQK